MSATIADTRGVVVPCANCSQRNRVPFDRLATGETRCGKCQTPLSAPAQPIEVPDASSFDALVRAATLPVIVDFWAPWCGPCRMVAPELERVAAGHAGEWLIVKVNTDAIPELGDRFGIRSIPTMSVFVGGREVTRTAGARPAAQIEAFVRQAI